MRELLTPQKVESMITAPVVPYTVPHPDNHGLGSFYESVMYKSEDNKEGLHDSMLLVTSEPDARPGETLEDVMARHGREYQKVMQSPGYRKGPSEVAFYRQRYTPPPEREILIAPHSERTREGMVRHAIAIRDANELNVP